MCNFFLETVEFFNEFFSPNPPSPSPRCLSALALIATLICATLISFGLAKFFSDDSEIEISSDILVAVLYSIVAELVLVALTLF